MNENTVWRSEERISFLLRRLYGQHGYIPYRMSKFEEYDLYVRNKSFLVSDQILTFTDTDGRLMALKPDVTLSIVKNTPERCSGLHKVYYNENVYRTSPAAMGYREIMQTGLECIGQVDLYATAEVISLAYRSLEVIGEDFLLDLSHMGLVSQLLQPVEEDRRRELLHALSQKNSAAIRALCRQYGLSHQLAEELEELALLYGPPALVLPRLEKLVCTSPARAAVEELEALWRLLEAMGCAEKLRLDFSIVNDMNYYNGLIFRGYLPGLASGVLAGGRYDNLLAKMGRQGGAIGFAVYLDQLERLESDGEHWDADVLLLREREDDPLAAAKRARELREQGLRVRVETDIPQGLRFKKMEKSTSKGDA